MRSNIFRKQACTVNYALTDVLLCTYKNDLYSYKRRPCLLLCMYIDPYSANSATKHVFTERIFFYSASKLRITLLSRLLFCFLK